MRSSRSNILALAALTMMSADAVPIAKRQGATSTKPVVRPWKRQVLVQQSEQAKREQEIADWNAEVARRKAEKKAAKLKRAAGVKEPGNVDITGPSGSSA